MKKIKLDIQSLKAEVLTRIQLKQILSGDGSSGGDSGTSCTTSADCPAGEGCFAPPHGVGGGNFCAQVSRGTSCITDSDCGNGQHCINKPYPFHGTWCN